VTVHVLGVRHHGPGCARSVVRALDRLRPGVVLIEGPPDAADVVPLASSPAMRPPVALLVYAPDRPREAAFYPFTDFSPEWQALQWAARHGVEARFIDLPVAVGFRQRRDAEGEPAPPDEDAPVDPIAELAAAAGYEDAEEWWDQQVERRADDTDLFGAILEAMAAVRQVRPDGTGPSRVREERREAHMRRAIRAARGEGHATLAVVCGAWHGPALTEAAVFARGQVGRDNASLKGLRSLKVVSTWVPWTNARLAFRSGYGAGVTSPGWYRLLWEHPEQATARWLARSAALLRSRGMDVSSAHVIEGVRLAEALAALRGLPRPGLGELREATTSVLLGGYDDALALVRSALEVGDRLGGVPEETPTVPLQQDFEATCRSLRLKAEAEPRALDLDLRTPNDRARSHLLWRLRALGVPWGEPQRDTSNRRQGTFWERWQIAWQPDFAVALIEANALGNTVPVAATGAVAERAADVAALAGLIDLLDAAILADLPEARDALLQQLAARAALSPDVHALVAALPPLARIARYGDVRGTAPAAVLPILEGLLTRVFLGLLPASSGLDDEAAGALADGLAEIQRILGLLDRPDDPDWIDLLGALSTHGATAPRIQGAATRLALDRRLLDEDGLRRLVGRALSLASEPPDAAAWLEGFLRGGGVAVLHKDVFWAAFDGWLRALGDEVFRDLLPALRRGFAAFNPRDRREVALRVASLRVSADGQVLSPRPSAPGAAPLAPHREARVLPVLATLLGVPAPAASEGSADV
jgi:hypothetical protein